jgi:hypothetical protein
LNPSEVLFLAANPFHVRQILGAGGGQFVPHQQFLADDPDRQAVEVRFNFGFPRFLEGNRRDGSQQVNPVGSAAQLNDGFRFAEIVRLEFWKSKIIDSGGNERGVFRRSFDEEVNVLRKTKQAVIGNGMPPTNRNLIFL